MIGGVGVGSAYPVRVQSMLDTSVTDVEACVEQAARVADAGAELVRVAVPGTREAEALRELRAAWHARGYSQPLVADVHFSAGVALEAVHHVEKVRVNPGNFASPEEARKKLKQLIVACKMHRVALRVGTNHGSLPARVTSLHGDTPTGMVEATMEYLRVCRDASFFNVVVSLKSSDCRVMVEATRLLVARMDGEGISLPVHLGVTEAGEGEDGRTRSAVGIGTLLNEGIGDTIRVSLTEAPEREPPVARELLEWCHPDYRPDRPVLPARCPRPLVVTDAPGGCKMEEMPATLPLVDVATFREERPKEGCVEICSPLDLDGETLALLATRPAVAVALAPPSLDHALYRELLEETARLEVTNRLIVRVPEPASRLAIASQVGGIFLDRLADGLWIAGEDGEALARDILQAAGARRYKTEFISCPGCGRTLFNLHEVTREVKRALSGFPRLKIAVMGCIVNGPGEMGDADYGYVGAGRGNVTLYKGGRVARTGVPEREAVEVLKELIAKDAGNGTE
jgi:(E)-4-hydroxy-3-methylbut-2-enyl-diphosphate synthase